MMRKFPKLLAVVLAIAIIICPAMCLTSMAETPANDYTVSYANDVVTVKVDAANGFLVALLRLDVEGFDVNEAGIAVTTTEGVEFGANPDFDADAGVLSLLLAAKDAANINVVTSATVTIPVTKTATDDNYGIKLTTIQAADAGSVVGDVLVAEDFIDFPYVADAEDGTIVDAPEDKVEAIKPCTHEHTTETTTDSTCTVQGSVTVTCDDCGATISSESLPLAEHVAGKYEFDENYHWNVCTYGCSEKLNNAEHVFDDDADADCICGFTREVDTHVCEFGELQYRVDDDGSTYGKCVTYKTCECGAEEIVKEIANVKFRHAPTYDADLSLLFRLETSFVDKYTTDKTNYSDVEAVFVKDMFVKKTNESAEPVVKTVPAFKYSSTRIQFTYQGIRSIDMASNINVKVYATVDGNKVLIASENYSMQKYIKESYDYLVGSSKAVDQAELKLIIDIANYGAAAQTFFDYNTKNLANSTIPHSVADGASAPLTAADYNLTGVNASTAFKWYHAPAYEDKVLMIQRFNKSVAPAGSYIVVDYKEIQVDGSLQDRSLTYTFDNEDPNLRIIQATNNANRYQITFESLTAPTFSTLFTITLYDAQGNALGYDTYSLEAYAYATETDNSAVQAEKDLVSAVTCYGRASLNYFTVRNAK